MGDLSPVQPRVEHIFIIHKERLEILYAITAPSYALTPTFLEAFRHAVIHEEIELPVSEGDISQGTLQGKFVVIRSGRFEYVAVVLDKNPDRFFREALHAFGIRLSSRWVRELQALYTALHGDTNFFKHSTAMGGTVDDLAEDCFYLSVQHDPEKLNTLRAKRIKELLRTDFST